MAIYLIDTQIISISGRPTFHYCNISLIISSTNTGSMASRMSAPKHGPATMHVFGERSGRAEADGGRNDGQGYRTAIGR